MKQRTKIFWKRIKGAVLAGTVILSVFAGGIKVHAETGSIYTCTVTRCYSHPVTGVIEDSGGEASYATGQGMVESVVGTTGMLEVTDSGNYYLTVRLGMMDYTTGHSFVVQNVGDSSWMSTTTEQTATGSDSNGTTADFRIQVPSESCVVRCSMNVTPMGRDVIFYFYPGSYTEGNSSGMTAGKVTEAAVENAATADSNATAESQTATSGAASTMADAATNADSTPSGAVGNSTAGASGAATNADSSPSGTVGNSTAATSGTATSGTAATTDSSATVENAAADTSAADGQVQGLNLSTAQNAATAGTDSNTTVGNTAATAEAAGTTAGAASTATETGTLSMGQLILALTVSMTIAGWIVFFTAIGVLHYIKKRQSWDGDDDEEE